MSESLRLRAEDADDLQVVAACLQDALVPVSEMMYLPDERRFILVVNRFKWENCDDGLENCQSYERVCCGLCFDGVNAVRLRGFDQRDRGLVLELLTIIVESRALILIFAGDAALRLETDRIQCRIEDLGQPWITQWRPSHPIDDVMEDPR